MAYTRTMSFTDTIRTMDKRLRLMLLATVLLIVPTIGQFITIRDLNTAGQASPLALLFSMLAVFIIPTSAILTGVILYLIRANWRHHERLAILGVLNLIIMLNLLWFFFAQCSWSQVFGISLKVCQG
jgi:predicted permease